MPSPYLRKLSDEEYSQLRNSLLRGQDGNCFICGKAIDLTIHGNKTNNNIDIDHVEPNKVGGKDGPDNFAVTHASCNRSKQASDLRVARVLASFDSISESIKSQGEDRSPNLGDVLRKNGGAKYPLSITVNGNELKTAFSDIDQNDILTFPVHEDKLSGFRYTFLNLPIEYLHHDDRINPRAIGTNLRKLVEEFHKQRPQLHIALGWFNTSNRDAIKVQIFDGQHKAAAQILLGTRCLPVRVFIDPDLDILLTANTHAGTTLRQVAFDKSVQRSLGSSLLKERMERYRRDCGRDDDDEGFSERELVNYFKGESREVKKYVIDRVRNSVTGHPDNKLRDYIDQGGRGSQKPLSYSTIEKTFYSFFIYRDLLTTPFNYKLEDGLNPRLLEIEQIVRLMNIIAEEIFIGKFETSLGTGLIEHKIKKGEDVPEQHLRAFRMAKEEIIYNWLRYVRQIVHSYFITTGKPIEENKLFEYAIPDICWENIKNFIVSLKRLPLWINKDLSVFGGKQRNDFWHGIFENGRTDGPNGVEVMPHGINLIDMMKHKASATG